MEVMQLSGSSLEHPNGLGEQYSGAVQARPEETLISEETQVFLLDIYYHFLLQSVLLYAMVSWKSMICAGDINHINKLIREGSFVTGLTRYSLREAAEKRIVANLKNIMNNPFHLLHRELTQGTISHSG